jgi:lysozyme
MSIGIGRNLDGNGITKDEAIYLMRNDIERCTSELMSYSWYRSQPRVIRLALINMCFNLGLTRLLKFKKMIAALSIHDYETAANEALDSRWAKQVGSRATDIADIIRAGAISYKK